MKIASIITAIVLSPLSATGVWSQTTSTPTAVETYELTKIYNTSRQTSDGSSSNSSGRDTILEHVIAVRDTGVELQYDLSKDAKTEERARHWQLPARVFRPLDGPMQLLNTGELEIRLEDWLKAARLDRSACGRWIFTWNAFHIDCDPQSVIKTIEAFNIGLRDLREGAAYKDSEAAAPGIIARKEAGPNGAIFSVILNVDPAAIRRTRAETDVVTGEILQKPVSLDAALAERAKEQVSGTISISFETDGAGRIWKRTKVTKLEIKQSNGTLETQTATETVGRRSVSAPTIPR